MQFDYYFLYLSVSIEIKCAKANKRFDDVSCSSAKIYWPIESENIIFLQ